MEQDRWGAPQADRGPTHYERLQVSPQAPAAVIRAAYRALAALHHPDRCVAASDAAPQHPADPSAPQPCGDTMAALNAAWAVLGDPQRRREYDAWLQATRWATAEPGRRPVTAPLARPRWQRLGRAWPGRVPPRAAAACALAAALVTGGSAWALHATWQTERAVVQAWQAAQTEHHADASPAHDLAFPAHAVAAAPANELWRESMRSAGRPARALPGAVAAGLAGAAPLHLRASVSLSAAD
jgi:hypothetical protein